MSRIKFLAAGLLLAACSFSYAGVDGSISGHALSQDGGVAIKGAKVALRSGSGKLVKETLSDPNGAFSFFPVVFGTYAVEIDAPGFQRFQASATVGSGEAIQVEGRLARDGAARAQEYVVNVSAKRRLVQATAAGSKTDITKDQIQTQPGGESISLPKLLATKTPGVVQGPFGQMFIRGTHGNIQYQIDGVQLPDSISGTFGDAFSPRNIDHMEVITGGIPAEYGERLAAVMNIVTKSGPEVPEGQVEINYGSYNTINPQLSYGGTNPSGRMRYFVSANYLQTGRGLDTPQPSSYADQSHGGQDAVHDQAQIHDEFARLDYVLDEQNKFTLNLYNSTRVLQIPNFPASFASSDPYFQDGYLDQFGNGGPGSSAINVWTPSYADNRQTEQNSYVELVWKKTFSERSFLQAAPYYKRSGIKFGSDVASDLPPAGNQPSALQMDRAVDNYGLKVDQTFRANDQHLLKAGFQVQRSNGAGSFSVQQSVNAPANVYGAPDGGALEAIYAQDRYSIARALTLNAGLRFSARSFILRIYRPQDSLVQPRLGLEYLAAETTKIHIFYGKLFQPAPFENLRDAFAANGGSALPYDVKAEKDDYYEIGIAQQIGEAHLASVNYYYKDATNMLDDTQLPGTSMAQPYNFAHGFATGVELSVSGSFAPGWSDFFNYAYEDARGQGISGSVSRSQSMRT